MLRRSSRLLAALLALLALAVGACSGDDDGDDGAGPTTSASTDSGTTDEDGSTTTGGEGGGSTTTPPSATTAGSGRVTSTAPPSGTDGDGVIELAIVGGEVQGGVRRERVAVGSEVTLRVTSDVADELHVHTYDLTVDLVPGRAAELTFIANIPGVHEVELEERGRRVLELEVGG